MPGRNAFYPSHTIKTMIKLVIKCNLRSYRSKRLWEGGLYFLPFFFLFNVNKCNLFINIALLVKFFAIYILVKISQSDWLLLAIDSKHGEKSCRICLVKFRKHKRKGRRKEKAKWISILTDFKYYVYGPVPWLLLEYRE